MLKGHVFKFQTFANEAFAHFINTFLQGNMGITKGCNLSKTSNSVTISAGYFCVMGRFLEIVGNETISNITNTGYYQLICEIDLSQTNTTSELNQASIKLVRNANAYSSLTKEDLFNGGSLYQYEFARFKVTEQGIIDFSDRRTFLNLTSLYSQINSNFNSLFNTKDQEAEALLEEIRQELASVIDGSVYLLKEGGTMSGDINMQNNKIRFTGNGGVEGNVTGNVTGNVSGNCSGSSGSCTGNAATATKLKDARTINGTSFNGTGNITTSKWGTARTLALSGAVSGSASVDGSGNVTISTTQANIAVLTGNASEPASTSQIIKTLNYPSGYTKDNCVPISFLTSYNPETLGWGTGHNLNNAMGLLSATNERSLLLKSDGIKIFFNNIKTETATIYYKIVLMKIS